VLIGGLGRGGRGGGGESEAVLRSGFSGRLVWQVKGGSRFPPYWGFLGSRRRRLRQGLREAGLRMSASSARGRSGKR
jgi:hypothetical protein